MSREQQMKAGARYKRGQVPKEAAAVFIADYPGMTVHARWVLPGGTGRRYLVLEQDQDTCEWVAFWRDKHTSSYTIHARYRAAKEDLLWHLAKQRQYHEQRAIDIHRSVARIKKQRRPAPGIQPLQGRPPKAMAILYPAAWLLLAFLSACTITAQVTPENQARAVPSPQVTEQASAVAALYTYNADGPDACPWTLAIRFNQDSLPAGEGYRASWWVAPDSLGLYQDAYRLAHDQAIECMGRHYPVHPANGMHGTYLGGWCRHWIRVARQGQADYIIQLEQGSDCCETSPGDD